MEVKAATIRLRCTVWGRAGHCTWVSSYLQKQLCSPFHENQDYTVNYQRDVADGDYLAMCFSREYEQ